MTQQPSGTAPAELAHAMRGRTETGRRGPGGWMRTGGTILVAVVTLLAPLFLSRSDTTVYVLLGTAAMVTIGVSLLMGFAGQISLGHAAFYAVGAYTAALTSMHGWPPLVGLACAPLLAGMVAGLVGIPILRLRGHYLAFATLALQIILLAIIGQVEFFGGDIGLQGVPQFGIGDWTLASPRAYAYLTWICVSLLLVVTYRIINSRPGRGLRALSTSETAAASSGVPVTRYKLMVFALSAACAGLAGGVYAFFLGYVSPGSFPVLLSVEFVVMAVVGGLGTVWGPVLGAAVITILVQVLNSLGTLEGMPIYASAIFSYAVYGLLLILVVLFLPRGLLPSISALVGQLKGRCLSSSPVASHDGEAVSAPR